MSIDKSLVVIMAMILQAMVPVALADETDSHCIVGKDGTLFNRCEYAVDIGFCVENPQQTKNFFDSSGAFECPNGGLSTIGPGEKEGNILNGTVHWFACNTKFRGGGRWGYAKGAGYTGYCTGDPGQSHSVDNRVASSDKPADWGAVSECSDWTPDKPHVLRQMDLLTKKEMCKHAISPRALEISSREFYERKRSEAAAEKRKREDAKAHAEYDFQQKLPSQTAWQLAALADQLKASGDESREGLVRQFLAERFPNHAQEKSAGVQRSNAMPVQIVRESTPKNSSAELSLATVRDCISDQEKLLKMLRRTDEISNRPARHTPPEELMKGHVEETVEEANKLDRMKIEYFLARRGEYVDDIKSRLAQARGGNPINVHRYEYDLVKLDFDFCFYRARLGVR